jgi:hypothetical protein
MDPTLISAWTALGATTVGPFMTLYIARRRFSADVLSTNRQKWIDAFRDRLAELLSLFKAAQAIKRASDVEWHHGMGLVIADRTFGDKVEKTYAAIAQIQLLTKPDEPAHEALNEAIIAALGHLQDDELRESELAACLAETSRLGRGIIRHEWARVKRGV